MIKYGPWHKNIPVYHATLHIPCIVPLQAEDFLAYEQKKTPASGKSHYRMDKSLVSDLNAQVSGGDFMLILQQKRVRALKYHKN